MGTDSGNVMKEIIQKSFIMTKIHFYDPFVISLVVLGTVTKEWEFDPTVG